MSNRIRLLDCTLRDGGYINDFRFGEDIIKDIISKLSKASIDIVECGFLRSGVLDPSQSLFGGIDALKSVIGKKRSGTMYVAMIQYGAIAIEEIHPNDGSSVDGIRVTFHEHEIDGAFRLAKELMGMGYAVFMQPVGTTTYSDEKLLELIGRINQLHPLAFYIVDTLGTMYKNDLLRMFYLVDHNLSKDITIGFHSHNNLQMSFANAQEIIQLNSPRQIIIDCTVYGMGRGAGNLNTELIAQYINTTFGAVYDNMLILELIDEYIKPLSKKYKWGYDAAYFIASSVGCHPNYSSFLLNKQTIRVQDIYAILHGLSEDRKSLYDVDYITSEYTDYLSHHVDDAKSINLLKELIGDRKVLLLAPGRSLAQYTGDIKKRIDEENYFVISVNFVPQELPCNLVFMSNMKRFKGIEDLLSRLNSSANVVVTSNLLTQSSNRVIVVDYRSCNNEDRSIIDNAGLMCMNLLNRIDVKDLCLVGFDGYTEKSENNFFDASLVVDVEANRLREINASTSRRISQLRKHMSISFLNDTNYE